jgi:hypothetical protein
MIEKLFASEALLGVDETIVSPGAAGNGPAVLTVQQSCLFQSPALDSLKTSN